MADSDSGYTDLFSSPLVQSYIAKAASDRGIDPRAAINVFRIESSLNPFTKPGDMGSSPGVAQLHFGGMAPGVLSHAGLGDSFARTGMSAFDSTTWPQQIDFALDNVANHGWGDYATTAYQKLGYSKYTGISNPGRPMPDIASYKVAPAPAGTPNANTQPAMPSIDPESLWVGPQAAPAAPSQSATPDAPAVDPESLWVGPQAAPAAPAAPAPATPAAAAPAPIQGPGRSPSGPIPPSQANAGLSGFLQGLPIAGPYVLPGMQKLTAWGQSQATGQPYDQALSAIQGYGNRSAAAYPGTALAGNIAGGVAGTIPMMAAAPAAFGVGVANPLAAGLSSGVTGAVLGGADAGARSGWNPQAMGQGAALGGAFGTAAPLAGRMIGGATGALGNATIGTLSPEDAALAARARSLGIPVNAGQMGTPGSFPKVALSALNQLPFSGNDPTAIKTGIMRAMSHTIGEDAPGITPSVMNAARTRIGNDFDTVANNTTLKVDHQFGQDLIGALNDPGLTKSMPEYEALQNQIRNVFNSIDQSNGTISGHVYQTLTQGNSPLSKLMRNPNPTLSNGAGEIKDALDGLLERSASPDMLNLVQQARSQWKALKTIEPLAAKADPSGYIDPALLGNRINTNPFSKNAMAYGQAGDLGDIAAIGKRFIAEPADSKTAIRSWIYGGLGGAFGLNELTGGTAVQPSTALTAATALGGAMLGGRVAGSALRSQWLANALINRSLAPVSAASRPSAAAANLLTRTLGPSAVGPTPNALGWSVTPGQPALSGP